MTWAPKGLRRATISDELCEVCDAPAVGHPACVDCGILAGPGHVVTGLDGEGRCASCAWAERRAGV